MSGFLCSLVAGTSNVRALHRKILSRTRSTGFGIRWEATRVRERQHQGRTTSNTGNRASMPNLLVWVFTHTHTHTHKHTHRCLRHRLLGNLGLFTETIFPPQPKFAECGEPIFASENIDFGHQEQSRQEINCVEVGSRHAPLA